MTSKSERKYGAFADSLPRTTIYLDVRPGNDVTFTEN